MIAGLIMGICAISGVFILKLIYGKKYNANKHTVIALLVSLALVIWLFCFFCFVTGLDRDPFALVISIAFPVIIIIWAIIVRLRLKKDKEILESEQNQEQEQDQETAPEIIMSEETTLIIKEEIEKETSPDISAELSYKEARKAAREEYKEKKKELKSTYPKQNKNKYKIATIVLSILLLGATIVNIAQFIYYEEYTDELFHEKLDLETENRDLQCYIKALEEQVENLSDDEKWSIDDVDLSKYEIIW